MKGERGFALAMVLILLALGSLMIVPGMQLVRTVLASRAIYAQDIRNDYAATSAIEYGMWKVLHDPGYLESLTPQVETAVGNVTVNGVEATASVVIYASQGGLSGVGLVKDHQILPSKAVFPSTAQPGVPQTFTYVITMKRLEPDDAKFDPLESVKDGLDLGFTYVPNSSQWDGVPFADDDLTVLNEPVKLKNEKWKSPVFIEADAMVDQASPDTNYGTDTTMQVQSLNGNRNRRSFVRFDIGAIPDGSTIKKAELTLCATAVPSPSREYHVYRVTETWDESTITWNNQPSVAGSRTDKENTPGSPGCMKWNVKSDVQDFVDGTETNYGWQIIDKDENSGSAETTTFRTQEDPAVPAEQPVLNVEIEPGYETIEWIFNPSFPGLAFQYGEEHTLTFQATATPEDNTRYCNVAQVKNDEGETNTGLTAPITVGTPTYAGCPGGGIVVTKTADPLIILPGVPTVVTYVISIINNDIGGFNKLDSIEDWLPPGYTYIAGSASAQWSNTAPFTPDPLVYGYSSPDNDFYGSPDGYNICDFEPELKMEAGRQKLKWHDEQSANGFNPGLGLCHDYPLPYGATYTQTFQALALVDETGSYYNEMIVKLKDAETYGGKRGMKDWDKFYSGPTGETVVPYADFAGATDISTLRNNAKWVPTGLKDRSWHWKKHR